MQHFYEVYYEPEILNYQLGRELRERFKRSALDSHRKS